MDRKPLVASKDYGKDETKAEVLLKKHDAVELDFEGFGATITHLNEKAVMMMKRGHFDRCVVGGVGWVSGCGCVLLGCTYVCNMGVLWVCSVVWCCVYV